LCVSTPRAGLPEPTLFGRGKNDGGRIISASRQGPTSRADASPRNPWTTSTTATATRRWPGYERIRRYFERFGPAPKESTPRADVPLSLSLALGAAIFSPRERGPCANPRKIAVRSFGSTRTARSAAYYATPAMNGSCSPMLLYTRLGREDRRGMLMPDDVPAKANPTAASADRFVPTVRLLVAS